MKKNYIWIVAAALAAAGYFVYRKMNFAKSLVFRLSDVKPDGSLKDPKVIISVNVSNPSNQKANVKAVTGTLYLDDREISIINTTTFQIIEPQSDSVIRIVAKPQLIGIAMLIKDLLSKSKRNKIDKTFKFIGNVNVDGVLLPINESIRL
jgi:LEA14-like dessication related protein